ncbi:DUF4214 domain-containing protein [Geodermatophilus nigrescens]
MQATPAQAAVNNDTIVQSWYRNFLGRSADSARADAGHWYWVSLLDRGYSRQWVLGGILRSHEYANREVSSYYNDLLGRAPDPGAGYWIDQTAFHGMAWEWVEQNILASPEYFNRFNYSRSAGVFIGNLYYDVLGRSASDGEMSYWAGRYAQVGALNTVREIWYSDEGVRYRLNENYLDILFRGADFAAVSYWSPLERQSDIAVQVELASSAEYLSRRVY